MTHVYQRYCFRIALFSILLFMLQQPVQADERSLQAALQKLLDDRPAATLGIRGRRMASSEISAALLQRYRDQELRPVWVSPEGPGERAGILFDLLKSAADEGLRTEDYRIDDIEALWTKRSDADLAKLEILLSVELAAYVADLREGRADPHRLDPELFASARKKRIDPVELAVEAVHSEDLAAFLAAQSPGHVYYQRLKKALADYRAIAAEGEWEAIPAGETLKPGMQSERILKVRERLMRSGDLAPGAPLSPMYDEGLETAVKRFQKRFHLEIDGAIGKRTVAAMNIPVSGLIRRIIVNMERWRWLSHDLGDKRIFVNIAGFYLEDSHDGTIGISMPVIVGKKDHKTPVFSAMIRYLEFNPYWNVPDSIAVNEMYPDLLKDPRYLEKKNIRLFYGSGHDAVEVNSSVINWANVDKSDMRRYRLRQDAGPKNSLGRIKFMFPNPYHVYLHDTPTRYLFNRPRRAFSHGCIRVSRPLELAAYLLGGDETGWTIEKMKKIIDSGKRKIVTLKKPYPIHILYRTASVGDDGLVYFADDIYGRDRLLEKALF